MMDEFFYIPPVRPTGTTSSGANAAASAGSSIGFDSETVFNNSDKICGIQRIYVSVKM